ncbi:Fasciclin domain-containing protein [Colletotrichum higginsianum IMI 349063]|uniref:Fasciclin domain-containing protein n=2 Tax=Colletotrichum higginsianum TaxID=80884 RepID=A0A1B7XY33_COLHI|nr:Fasciclin domain-containing protein [Colletotrichum higginsianum IMI 349063]OBR04676.1 Fasciclin domain-containing protein [Colletotrichum higginsianum IMI 349063]TIC94173.1 Fasciclin-like arabinogalactan protein [Colletotrichum higginsianum]
MRPSTRAFLSAVASVVLLGASTVAAQGLEEVLGKQANLTTFRRLVKEHEGIFSKLSESGVTILAPSDSAYLKGQGWDSNKDEIPVALQYGVLVGRVSFGALLPGNSTLHSTLLTDARFSNVTGGQQVLVTKQPNGDVVVTSGMASRTTALETDIPFDGGLVQVIDSLMVSPARLERTARDAYPEFTSFLGALYTAGLVEEFAETKNVTVFAPRNAAFQRVAATLSGMDREALRRVLRYHLVPSAVAQASSLANGTRLATAVDGESLDVTLYNNDVFVDSARIIQTDILVANGVMQMIDAVLNVDAPNVVPNVTAVSQAPVFTVTGTADVGTAAPTPFVSALPCTAGCPVTGGSGGGGAGGGGGADRTATGGVAQSSSTGGAAAAARCTGGLVRAAAAGVGLGLAVGAMGVAL